jgi:hypothetical protein
MQTVSRNTNMFHAPLLGACIEQVGLIKEIYIRINNSRWFAVAHISIQEVAALELPPPTGYDSQPFQIDARIPTGHTPVSAKKNGY